MTTEVRIPQQTEEKLRAILLRVQSVASATFLYRERLIPAERRKIGDLTNFLDDNPGRADGLSIAMWRVLNPVSQPRAIVEVGIELGFLPERDRERLLEVVGESPRTLDDAIEFCDVVLDESEREFYWRRQRVDVPFARRLAPWTVVSKLVERAKSGTGIDSSDFGEVEPDYVSKQLSRLRHQMAEFPNDFLDRVRNEDGFYRLDVAPERIAIFRASLRENVEELVPSA